MSTTHVSRAWRFTFLSSLFVAAVASAIILSPSISHAAAFTWDGTSNTWGSSHWLPGPVAGPTTAGNTAAINSGVVSFTGHDTFGNAATPDSPAITLGAGGQLNSGGNNFNTMWNLTLGGGTLHANGGHASWGAFALAGNVTVNGSTASTISSDGGVNSRVDVRNGGTTFNVSDVTGNSATDLTVSAVLANGAGGSWSNGSLIKDGSGTMNLTAANTYTGSTIVSGGTLVFSGGGSTSTASALHVQNGGTVRFDRNDTWGNAGTVSTPVVTIDAGGLVQSNNKYTTLIGLVLNGGTLSANDGVGTNYPTFGLKSSVSVNATASGSFISTTGVGDHNTVSIGTGAANGTTTFNVADGAAAADLTVSAPLSNFAGAVSNLAKSGAGTMQLTTANTYSGRTDVLAGTLQVTGGTINGGVFDIGQSSANATGFILDSGSVTAASQFVIGAHGSTTTAVQHDGALQVNGTFYLGGYGQGTSTSSYTQYGGTVATTSGMRFDGGGPNSGIYNLAGGMLTTPLILETGGSGTGTFNFDGGTLRAAAHTATFMQGLTAANVEDGGAVIHTDGFNVTIAQALLDGGGGGGLTKLGGGTLTLTGANTYTGNTDIQAGILSINSAYLNDYSDILLTGGATFDLNFAGIDTIGSLSFDGISQTHGTYGALGSGAKYESAFFTGNGLLEVVPEPSSIALFAFGLMALAFGLRRRLSHRN